MTVMNTFTVLKKTSKQQIHKTDKINRDIQSHHYKNKRSMRYHGKNDTTTKTLYFKRCAT